VGRWHAPGEHVRTGGPGSCDRGARARRPAITPRQAYTSRGHFHGLSLGDLDTFETVVRGFFAPTRHSDPRRSWMRRRPYCAQRIKDDAERCKWCRRVVLTRTEQGQLAKTTPQSPAEQTRTARAAGARLFQLAFLISDTAGYVVKLSGAFTSTRTRTVAQIGTLEAIEAQGWSLDHAHACRIG
jgi:hypothetical protein